MAARSKRRTVKQEARHQLRPKKPRRKTRQQIRQEVDRARRKFAVEQEKARIEARKLEKERRKTYKKQAAVQRQTLDRQAREKRLHAPATASVSKPAVKPAGSLSSWWQATNATPKSRDGLTLLFVKSTKYAGGRVRRWLRLLPDQSQLKNCPRAGTGEIIVSDVGAVLGFAPKPVRGQSMRASLTPPTALEKKAAETMWISADAVLDFAALRDPAYAGKTAEDIHPDDLRQLEGEMLHYIAGVEELQHTLGGPVDIPRHQWERIAAETAVYGRQAALHRAGQENAFAHYDEPLRTEMRELADGQPPIFLGTDKDGFCRLYEVA